MLRVLYDENNLYFIVYAYDSMPDQIAVRAMARDGAVTTSDKFSLYPIIQRTLPTFAAGLHIKTAGTTSIRERHGATAIFFK